jgi:Sortilin, neurotensin receptor 3,
MKHIPLLIASFIFYSVNGFSQSVPGATPAEERLEGYQQRIQLKTTSWFADLPFSNIGPTICSGRVVDVDVNPSNPNEMYVAYASGGLWYTNNNATTLTPVFDQEACMTIGDVAVNWNEGIIWLGTGENNSSRSSYAGIGLYKSMDNGKTWKNMGLTESHHIGRILIHPFNPNVVHVACLGSLYSENPNRGVYSTSDGGVTWRQSLFVNAGTGAIDLVADPSNPNIIYAATWERSRRAWNFTESGPGSAIYISTDSGRNWKHLTTEESGFPTGAGAGRIGLDIVRSKNETILFAIIDNQDERPRKNLKRIRC